MRRRIPGVAVGALAASLLAGIASAQVVLGPGNQYGVPGDTVEFQFAVAGPMARDVAMAQFVMAYDPGSSVFDPVADASGVVDCAMTPDLAGRMAPGPVMYLPEHDRIVVTFGVTGAPIEPLGRDGVVLTCRFTIRPDAVPGVHPLVCIDAPPASSERGTDIPTTCANGTLTIEGGGQARAAAPLGGRVAQGGGVAPAPVVGEAVVAGGAAGGAAGAGGQAPAAGAGVAASKAAPAGAVAREAGAPQAPAPGAGEAGTAPGVPQEPAGVATALGGRAATPKGSPAAPAAAAAAATPVPAATRPPAAKGAAPAATAAKAQQAEPKPTVKESGCAMSPQRESGWAWVPAVPLVAVLLLRRRCR